MSRHRTWLGYLVALALARPNRRTTRRLAQLDRMVTARRAAIAILRAADDGHGVWALVTAPYFDEGGTR